MRRRDFMVSSVRRPARPAPVGFAACGRTARRTNGRPSRRFPPDAAGAVLDTSAQPGLKAPMGRIGG
ncbi:hypothetical protein GCM10022205_41350 [Spinactinospora alkalitolerans]